jgi:adenine-specific DNA-methyltransferase
MGLCWPGKAQARALAATACSARLVPVGAMPRGAKRARHLFIEGDNLDALKLLHAEFAGRVHMIYIDPPYNTGRQLLYDDRFRGGSANGRFARNHAAWLDMMYPRLLAARPLLREDGLFFLSIDDREAHALRLLMDEAFGEESRLATFVWRRRSGSQDARSGVSVDHEYVLCYGGKKAKLPGEPRTFAAYRNPDNDPRGPWIADNLSAAKPGGDVHYAITDPATGREFLPPEGRYWPYNPETMRRKIAEGRVLFPRRAGGRPMLKRFQAEARSTRRPVSTWMEAAAAENGEFIQLASATSTAATRELKRLFGDKVFLHAKPVRLIRSLLSQGADDADAMVLDFFAGSCTTAQAVLEQNAEDGGARRFIMIEQAAPLPAASAARKLGLASLAALGQERIRRVIARLRKEGVAGGNDGCRVLRVRGR